MGRHAAVLAATLLLGGTAAATHVTDKLAVGLYDAPGAAQPQRLLTSGTPVERLGRQGGDCRVRLGDGSQGWLECRYLTDEKPARAMLLEAQATAAGLRRELARARQRSEAQGSELERLRRRLQAAESLLGEPAPDPKPSRPTSALAGAAAVDTSPKGGAAPVMDTWLVAAMGGGLGLMAGAGLSFWRCRRRYGGLRF